MFEAFGSLVGVRGGAAWSGPGGCLAMLHRDGAKDKSILLPEVTEALLKRRESAGCWV